MYLELQYSMYNTVIIFIYYGLECHSGGRFESEMYNTGSDRNRKNNCVRIKEIF